MSANLSPEQTAAALDESTRPLCETCARRFPSGKCGALAVLASPWARFIAAPYADDPGQRRQRALVAGMQVDTDAAEDYRRGAANFCDAFRSAGTAPADEGRGILINLGGEE